MTSVRDIAWLAGLLEGEGCFGLNNAKSGRTPLIALTMTDFDVIDKAAQMFDRPVYTVKIRQNQCKTPYRIHVYGHRAIEWMMTVYPFMGERRRNKIRESINAWHAMKRQRKAVKLYRKAA